MPTQRDSSTMSHPIAGGGIGDHSHQVRVKAYYRGWVSCGGGGRGGERPARLGLEEGRMWGWRCGRNGLGGLVGGTRDGWPSGRGRNTGHWMGTPPPSGGAGRPGTARLRILSRVQGRSLGVSRSPWWVWETRLLRFTKSFTSFKSGCIGSWELILSDALVN